ncbi:MAG: hypothetical protein GY861_01240 [bacterium]|nr:hypothetical protein [bacterium]
MSKTTRACRNWLQKQVEKSMTYKTAKARSKQYKDRIKRLEMEIKSQKKESRVTENCLSHTNDMLKQENLEFRERVTDISEKMCKLEIQRHPKMRRLRVCVDIDSTAIEMGMMHGNDHLIIDCIGKDLGRRAANEIRRANFQRWGKDPHTPPDNFVYRP